MTAKKAAGHSSKHVSSRKHQGTSKHHPAASKKSPAVHKTAAVHAKGKHPGHAKARGLAVGELLPVCSFEVLAASLRLAGQFVHDDEVAWLWELAGAPAAGASVAAALDTARLHGLAGFRPQRAERLEWLRPVQAQDQVALPLTDDPAVHVDPFEHLVAGDFHALAAPARFRPVDLYSGPVEQTCHLADVGHAPVDDLLCERILRDVADDIPELPCGGAIGEYLLPFDAPEFEALVDLLDEPLSVHALILGAADPGQVAYAGLALPDRSLILGVDRPGPHAVLATPDGWWSWGELWSPWPCRIEEAWAVSW